MRTVWRITTARFAASAFSKVVGPQLVTYTMHLWPPHMFAASFVAQSAVAALSAFVLVGVRLPMPTAAEVAGGRALGVTARQPLFVTAVRSTELADY